MKFIKEMKDLEAIYPGMAMVYLFIQSCDVAKCHAYHSNLSKFTGIEPGHLKNILHKLESDGFIGSVVYNRMESYSTTKNPLIDKIKLSCNDNEGWALSILIRDYAWIKKVSQAKIVDQCNKMLDVYNMLEITASELSFILKTQIICCGNIDQLNVSSIKEILKRIRSIDPLQQNDPDPPPVTLEKVVRSMAKTIMTHRSWRKADGSYDRQLVYELYSNMVGPYIHQINFVFDPNVVNALASLPNPIILK